MILIVITAIIIKIVIITKVKIMIIMNNVWTL